MNRYKIKYKGNKLATQEHPITKQVITLPYKEVIEAEIEAQDAYVAEMKLREDKGNKIKIKSIIGVYEDDEGYEKEVILKRG